MKTKILILSLTLFVLSSCVKDDLSINHSAIEKAKDDSRGAGDGGEDAENVWHWAGFYLNIYYSWTLTQNEIDIIRNHYFTKYHINRKDIKLISYETIGSHHEIWYGEEWYKGYIDTLPVENTVTNELDQDDEVEYN